MQTITFTCETITPMFLAGADGVTPELRAPSIKGALRFWWRAMNGHLSLKELKEQEGKIFGDTLQRSAIGIHILPKDLSIKDSELVPHKPFMKQKAFETRQFFDIRFILFKEKIFHIEKMKSLFEIVVSIGGIGKRSRRGMGGLKIKSCQINDTVQNDFSDVSLEHLLNLIKQHSKHYNIVGDSIRNTYQGRMEYYGWIRQIQIGEPLNKEVTKITSDATHQAHQKFGRAYESNLGHAFKGRFASPVYVSVLGDDKTPIITTLNAVPDRGRGELDLYIQDNFKNQILK